MASLMLARASPVMAAAGRDVCPGRSLPGPSKCPPRRASDPLERTVVAGGRGRQPSVLGLRLLRCGNGDAALRCVAGGAARGGRGGPPSNR